jgi:hypothetical protein
MNKEKMQKYVAGLSMNALMGQLKGAEGDYKEMCEMELAKREQKEMEKAGKMEMPKEQLPEQPELPEQPQE